MAISRKIGFAAPEHKRPTGWKWDEMIWAKEQQRHQAVIPTLMDPDISLIPEDLWRSGIGDGEDLRIMNVVEDPHAGIPWRPVIKPGFYYLAWEQFYLFSPNSVVAFLGTDTHDVWGDLSKVDLFWPPKGGEPFVISYLHRRDDGDIRDVKKFRHRIRFTGETVIETDQYGDLVSKTEAVDLDADGNVVDYNIANLPVDPEPRPREFVVIQRPEAFTKEWIDSNHTVGQGTSSLEVVVLGGTPVYGPPVAFSNMNLFLDYVHDTMPLNPGEYSIGYAGSINVPEGEVWVMTDDQDQVPGYVTYWTDYPATVLFNDYYVKRIGFESPSGYEEVSSGDFIGKSRMLPNQSFYLSYFPVLDPTEVRIFVYDPRNEQYSEWLRADDLETAGPDDEVFSISPDGGFVLFGDGIKGKIPHRYAYIAAHYEYVPLIEYMPDETILPVKPDTINLQPLNNSVHRGFIFLGHKEPLVDQLILTTDRPRVPGRPEVYGPIDAGNDYALLTCTAYARDGDVVPDQELRWALDPSLGYINGTNPYYTPVRTVTDQSGRSRVTYTPVRTAVDMGVIVNLYEGDGSSTTNLTSTHQPNDTLILDEPVEGSVNDMWVFMVTNDDPLLPYDPARREGGRYVVLYRWDEDYYHDGVAPAGEWVPVRPAQMVGTKRILFDYSLPSPSEVPSLVQYVIIMDRVVTVNASTMNPVTGVQVISNDLKLLLRIPASQRGVFTLSGSVPDGSALDSAAYLTIARDGTMRFIFSVQSSTSTSSTTTTTTSNTSSSTSSTTSSSTSSSSTTTVPHGKWVSILDNTKWQDGGAKATFTWNVGGWWEWAGAPGTGYLEAIGTWADGFRPTMVRVTYSGTLPSELQVVDDTLTVVGSDGYYHSGSAIEFIPFLSNDIFQLRFNVWDSDLNITNIEFRHPGYTSTTSSTTTTTTTATLPFMLPASDGPSGTPLDPLALQWVPTPAKPATHFDKIDDGTLFPPADVDYLTAVGIPLTDQLVLGPPSAPGVYSAALVTLRMVSAAPGVNPIGDQVNVVLYDNLGAPIVVGPTAFFNTLPATAENIQILIPFTGPVPDVALTGGVLEFSYSPGPGGPLDVTDVRIELI